ncbi:ParB/RepB/Spo0J family partition protein [Amycolatopsis jiangsuensis]|uniref:ParB-like chromosome segregation protein Spo0J n=1 Tax=Amycolatopsis jiangsuensis TaxID=1181879 RepID=A0A840J2E3_9PSEU|nr:ParB N-terminal domain-containing protein [Amycolatopsis jiangsuensis]MBB4689231.1 ParB-like chromosome segregation protein Spo0J [Amycolatopsis jiangsuensis]
MTSAHDFALPEHPRPVHLTDVTATVTATRAQVPVATLLPADSPRRGGADPEHVARLAAIDGPLPPILVDRHTMRVIDGTHRLLAAAANGHATIAVEYFDGTAEDAFLRAVRANVTHGLPLSQEDRRTAARRIVSTHPHLSDRAIADVAGLSAKTVAIVRRGLGDATSQPAARVGRDGKLHPLDKAAGRNRAAALIGEHPDASLREIARRAGVSPATVSDVRKRLACGAPPAGTTAPVPPATAHPAGDTAAVPAPAPAVPAPAPVAVPELRRPDPGPLLAKLVRDPSLRGKEDGRQLLRLLHRGAAAKNELSTLATAVPSHCAEVVHGLARHYAEMWLEFAQQLG